MSRQILLLNGPNLNLLGRREPEVYGADTLDDVVAAVTARATTRGASVREVQSNVEGELIDALHGAREDCVGVIFNPGAYTHTSIALRDAIVAVELPVVEVHLSNVHARETFRHTSMITAVCLAVVAGFGAMGYELALDGMLDHLDRAP